MVTTTHSGSTSGSHELPSAAAAEGEHCIYWSARSTSAGTLCTNTESVMDKK